MHYNLLIRKLDKNTESSLKDIAAKKGIGLETLARQVLTDFALSPEVSLLDEKYRNLMKDMTALYKTALDRNTEVIEENNYLLHKIVSLMEGEE